MDIIRQTFSDWLCNKLDQNEKITQSSLARELGINRSTVNHWCKGTRTPSPICKEKIAMSSLFGIKANPKDEEGKKKALIVPQEVFDHNLSVVRRLCHDQEMYKWISNRKSL